MVNNKRFMYSTLCNNTMQARCALGGRKPIVLRKHIFRATSFDIANVLSIAAQPNHIDILKKESSAMRPAEVLLDDTFEASFM